MVRRIARNIKQGRAAIIQIVEIDANSGVNMVRIRRLEETTIRGKDGTKGKEGLHKNPKRNNS